MADNILRFRELDVFKKFLLVRDTGRKPDVYFKIPLVSVYTGYKRVGSTLLVNPNDKYCILSSEAASENTAEANAMNLTLGLLAAVNGETLIREISH
jgi:hypothetical protein